MIHTADGYFDDQRLSDLHVFSTMGLEDEDVDLLETLEDTRVQIAYSMDVVFEESGQSSKIMGLPDNYEEVNQPFVVEGRLPQTINEIALDNTNSYVGDYKIGDTVQIEEGTPDEFEENFSETTFEVVGFVNHPRYIERMARGNTQVGTGSLDGFALVLEEVFDMEVHTDAYLLFENAREYDVYSEDYNQYIDERTEEVEALLADRPSERYEALVEEIEEEISDGYYEIEEARQELEDAEQELEDARIEIEEGFEDYEEGLAELEQEEADARSEIEDQRAQLQSALAEVESNRQQLEAAQIEDPLTSAELDAQEEQIQQGLAQLEQAETELDNEIQEARAETRRCPR
ncbi:MAG: hypothetical protein LRY37_02940 [Alkalibacterium thalassium]|nr:hypothetical protein [Alkalibacterium thalassium]